MNNLLSWEPEACSGGLEGATGKGCGLVLSFVLSKKKKKRKKKKIIPHPVGGEVQPKGERIGCFQVFWF
jgi:hypothetical protein